MEACRCGGMGLWRRVASMQPWRYGGVELCQRAVGVATWRHGGMELWSPRGALKACRQWRYGLLEMRCSM